MRWLLLVVAWLAFSGEALGGLHYSGEPVAELPSQWRGFLSDLRSLRNIVAAPGSLAANVSPLRKPYEEDAARLQAAARDRPLTAREAADLGAVLLRLGQNEKALQVLRQAQREHPRHFEVLSNLGTAWQLAGDLERAAEALEQAVALAPERFRKAESHQLRLIQQRRRQPRNTQMLDDLFGGRLETNEVRKDFLTEAVAVCQQLAIWLPHDPRLIWQLAELARASGDLQAAAELFETCVGAFAYSPPLLREHRQAVREAAAALTRQPSAAAHGEHARSQVATRSRRPLVGRRFDPATLPPLRQDGVNAIPWALLLDTTLDRRLRPTFSDHLRQRDQLQVSVTGFIQPLGDDPEFNTFLLIESPTGCWFCEMPEPTGIILVELAEGRTTEFQRGLIKVYGKLVLNSNDPEGFLYTLREARIAEAD